MHIFNMYSFACLRACLKQPLEDNSIYLISPSNIKPCCTWKNILECYIAFYVLCNYVFKFFENIIFFNIFSIYFSIYYPYYFCEVKNFYWDNNFKNFYKKFKI